MAVRTWVCPMLCGCVIQWRTDWVDADGDGTIDSYTYDGPDAVLSQCAGHAQALYPDVATLWGELKHLHGTAHRPDTCGCSLSFWWDDRESEDVRVHHPVDHPVHTKRCKTHAALTDHVAHHDAVTAENRAKNVTVNAVAAALGWVPESVDANGITIPEQNASLSPDKIPWSFDQARAIVVDNGKLGVAPSVIASALAAVKL